MKRKRRNAPTPAPKAPRRAPSRPPKAKTKKAPPPPCPPKKQAGRPSKLTDEAQAAIVSAIERGHYHATAIGFAGIGQSTFTRWMDKGQREEPEFERYRAFRAAVLLADATAEDVHLTRINQASRAGAWQASAWFLERKYPDRWGRKDKVQHEGADAFAAFLDEVARKRQEQVSAAAQTSGDAA